jgi:hypothetical protein
MKRMKRWDVQLWRSDSPTEEDQLERVAYMPVRQIIADCLMEGFDTRSELHSKHYLDIKRKLPMDSNFPPI